LTYARLSNESWPRVGTVFAQVGRCSLRRSIAGER
jgi:hypothetical protein